MREWSIIIIITIKNDPNNPQQHIHSLRLAPVSFRLLKLEPLRERGWCLPQWMVAKSCTSCRLIPWFIGFQLFNHMVLQDFETIHSTPSHGWLMGSMIGFTTLWPQTNDFTDWNWAKLALDQAGCLLDHLDGKKNVFFASQNGRCQTSEMSIFQKVRDENSKFSGHETQKTKLRILPCSLRCSSNIKSQEVITLQWGSVKDTATLY